MNFKRLITSFAVVAAVSVGVVAPAFAQSSFGKSTEAPPVIVDKENPPKEQPKPPVEENKISVVINQGDHVQTNRMACTLAYVGDGFAITAAHCGGKGESVYQSPFAGGKKIGTYDLIDTDANQDVAIIKLDDKVGGSNKYSGDRIASMAELSKNDVLCQYGGTTTEVHCGPQYGLARHGFMWSTNPARHGDSGGPVWIEGKGLIGVISTLTSGGTGISEAWITADKYGVDAPMASHTSDWPGGN